MYKVGNMSNIAIFDLDGTLVDTDAANAAAYDVALRRLGFAGIAGMYGRVSSNIVRKAAKLCDDEMDAVIRAKVDVYRRVLGLTRLGPAADALRFVLDNRNAFSKVVLLTDSTERRAYETLQHWSLNGCFDEIVCNGGRGDKYANYFSSFDSDPAASVVWENENRQIYAAIAAGVRKNNIRKVA
jgi:beta-phosphoglucomutase-like phosphatase (HAD superfamily)